MQQLNLSTSSHVEFQDITSQVQQVVNKSGTREGICVVFVPHTTAAVMLNEHADPAVIEDITAHLEVLAPENGNYRHEEGNSPGHIKAALLGDSVTVCIKDGRLVLGTWQGIFFCEFDGPRSRQVLIKTISG
jgi:secondary thiamine-phosphate synthase enzyme